MNVMKTTPDQQVAEIRSQATALNQSVEDGYLYLTCGAIMGKLHKNRFYCPGIHMECIEADNGKMVTPKTFVKMGEKEKLKDWKTAVRVNGIPIRKFMDTGYLDFYRHKETCTMRCLSRAITMQRSELAALSETTLGRESPKLQGKPIITYKGLNAIQKMQYPGRAIPVSLVAAVQNSIEKPVVTKSETIVDTASRNSMLHLNMAELTKNVIDKELGGKGNGASHSDADSSYSGADTSFGIIKKEPGEFDYGSEIDMDQGELSLFEHCKDSQVFWQGILQVGLLDNVVEDIVSVIHKLKTDLLMSSIGKEESRRLSKIVEHLGLMDRIREKVARHRCEMLRQKDVLKREMEELKKKVAAAELKEFELKRKSACFDQLMEMSMKISNFSMPSPAPSDRSEPSTFGDDPAESEHSEMSSDDRASFGGKRSRKPKRTVRIPPDGDVSENGYKSEEFEPEVMKKRKLSGTDDDAEKRVRCSEDEEQGEEAGGEDE